MVASLLRRLFDQKCAVHFGILLSRDSCVMIFADTSIHESLKYIDIWAVIRKICVVLIDSRSSGDLAAREGCTVVL